MCGIYGYFSRSGETLSPRTLAAMGVAIAHRGPDDADIYASEGVALGNQRLSVIDIAGGRQPFISDDGAIVVVQNGEIFNHVELAAALVGTAYACRTHSDTEVLLRLYEQNGIDFVEKLNGMFAIAILDRREQALYLIRDRIGVKPYYFSDDGDKVVFGSEIKALAPALGGLPAVDPEALHHFLTFNYVPPPFTFRQGIKHLMPGHVMRIDKAGAKTWRWWDLSLQVPVHDRPEADWMDEFVAILDDAVRIRMRSDVPFGAFLSGGVDSSTIVGLMARHATAPVKTFCIGFDDPRYDEASYAQMAADRFGTDHQMERVDPDMLGLWPFATYHCDQPHGDVSFLPTYRVSQLAAKRVKVVLTGDGGDELFAGYDKYRDFFASGDALELNESEFQKSYFDSISLFKPERKLSLYTDAVRASLAGIDSFEIARGWLDQVPHQDRINQALYLDMQLLLSGNNLVKPDRMGMAVSIEARTPFLDYRMMEFAFRMPGTLKLKDGVTKYIYKKAVAPLIGKELAYRKKQMFTVPVGDWFRHHLAGYCKDHLEDVIARSDMFRAEPLRALVADHVSGAANNTREIRAMIAIDFGLQVPDDQSGIRHVK